MGTLLAVYVTTLFVGYIVALCTQKADGSNKCCGPWSLLSIALLSLVWVLLTLDGHVFPLETTLNGVQSVAIATPLTFLLLSVEALLYTLFYEPRMLRKQQQQPTHHQLATTDEEEMDRELDSLNTDHT